MNDGGFICPYSTNYFEKTDAELLKERRDNLLTNLGI
jgi:ATP-dependent RNA circularization protein (DNA/RNA ligase family)